ncbi:uncharacterized protein LOC130725510 [Lotus japonicus]|uniref:uncharacterized protein LOC130725510 n=1 Tax=Lotus japonicus TaxID=34305 RepID=UPI002585ACA3|nr:uncharacterized protein LOC130725510 [Lotus japonicus]
MRPSLSNPPHLFFPFPSPFTLTFNPKPFIISRKSQPLLLFAVNNNEKGKTVEGKQEEDVNDSSKQTRPALFGFNWKTLLDPDPDNVVALGLTGLLTWASVQVLWQLLFISFTILVAALKYSFIAALLIFILITLL